MSIVERIKILANQKKVTLAEIERNLGFANSSIRRWDERTPGIDRVESVADYFDVSTDYLLGRTDKKNYYELTEKDEKNIQTELQEMIADLSTGGALSFSKEDGEMSEETKEALIISLENSLRIAKIESKKRFTPKKYRD